MNVHIIIELARGFEPEIGLLALMFAFWPILEKPKPWLPKPISRHPDYPMLRSHADLVAEEEEENKKRPKPPEGGCSFLLLLFERKPEMFKEGLDFLL
ncbi:MAG: hypothetical protein JWN89_494 [Parcubacteria group bacterium]|nr:hypothetical protein [Parcubacteria group bacterium]